MKSVTHQLILFFVALVLFAPGCAKKLDEESLPALSVAERNAKLEAFNPWRVSGSIALESSEQGKFNASFSWDTDRKGFDIKLFGPLGVQAFQLTQTPDGAELIDRDGQVVKGDAEELLLAATGYTVPISQMQDWAVGLPGDALEIERDKAGRLESMVVEKGGATWNVDFERYKRVDDLDLPRAVQIDSDGIKIRLSFKKWTKSGKPANTRLIIPGVST